MRRRREQGWTDFALEPDLSAEAEADYNDPDRYDYSADELIGERDNDR